MRKRNLLIGVLGLALALSLVWGYNQYQIARQMTINQENQYQQAYRDMVGHVDNLEDFLAKGMGSNSNSNNLIHFTGAWQESNAALADLSNLPVDNPGSGYISQFLNQASDFSYILAQRLAGGENIKPEEQKTLANFHESSRKVGEDLSNLRAKADYEDLTWTGTKPKLWTRLTGWFTGRAEADSTDVNQPVSVSQGIQLLDAQLQKLPPFEYHGKFNSQVTQEPKGLPPGEVTKEQAQDNLNRFFSQLGLSYNLTYTGDSQGNVPTYRFNPNGSTNVVMEATKRGGIPIFFDDQRDIGERVLTPDQAKIKASAYLRSLNYPTMRLTSQEDYGSYLTLSYVVQQDGVRIYPDKVMVRIAMDNGQLVGYNARPYLMFHRNRSLGTTRLTVAQARLKLKENFKVSDTALVLLAKDNYDEILCYEFRGRIDSEEYLIYINASSGFEEKIYRVLQTPVGEYVM